MAACCSRYFKVTGLSGLVFEDVDPKTYFAKFNEPDLESRIKEGFSRDNLWITGHIPAACSKADVLWLCIDTPVDERDHSDVGNVLGRLSDCLEYIPKHCLVLVSSQLPVGTIAELEKRYPFKFACVPENLVRGRAVECFEKADRVILGIRDDSIEPKLRTIFSLFTLLIIVVKTESAEMIKHALNSFLGMSIAFINEIAEVAKYYGADPMEVSKGLKTDSRIGQLAYLTPGAPFTGGTLGRDLKTLEHLKTAQELPLISSIWLSNELHKIRYAKQKTLKP